jgi:hypothetical protein
MRGCLRGGAASDRVGGVVRALVGNGCGRSRPGTVCVWGCGQGARGGAANKAPRATPARPRARRGCCSAAPLPGARAARAHPTPPSHPAAPPPAPERPGGRRRFLAAPASTAAAAGGASPPPCSASARTLGRGAAPRHDPAGALTCGRTRASEHASGCPRRGRARSGPPGAGAAQARALAGGGRHRGAGCALQLPPRPCPRYASREYASATFRYRSPRPRCRSVATSARHGRLARQSSAAPAVVSAGLPAFTARRVRCDLAGARRRPRTGPNGHPGRAASPAPRGPGRPRQLPHRDRGSGINARVAAPRQMAARRGRAAAQPAGCHRRRGGSARAALALLLAAVACVSRCAGHAVMIDPPSRPWLDYLENYNYLPHQVFAGGEAPRGAMPAAGPRRCGGSACPSALPLHPPHPTQPHPTQPNPTPPHPTPPNPTQPHPTQPHPTPLGRQAPSRSAAAAR